MREIKFRAWDGRAEKMLPDVLVRSHAIGTSVMVNWGHMEVPYSPGGNWSKDDYGYYYSIDNTVVPMQYTDLKDKNGVEIYEGDVLQDGTGETVVSFDAKGDWGQ